MKLVIDPGHGGKYRDNVGPTGYVEADGVLDISLRLKELLNPYCQVIMTRETDATVELEDRVKIANDNNADLFISVHTNAGGSDAEGTETYHSIMYGEERKVAELVQQKLVDALQIKNRGVKTRIGSDGKDYYYVIKYTKMPAVLVEVAFHSNPKEEALLKTKLFKFKAAMAIADAVIAYMGNPVPLIGVSDSSVGQAMQWARSRGAHQRFIDIADTYWQRSRLTGIRPEVLYCQAAKETNFGKFTGAVSPEFNNWAGIKILKPTADRPEDHQKFTTPDDGVRAHFNHISAYLGLEPIGITHPRYNLVKSLAWAGTIRTVEEPGGKWAPNPDYGKSIVEHYLKPLLATEVQDRTAELEQEIKELKERINKLTSVLNDIKDLMSTL